MAENAQAAAKCTSTHCLILPGSSRFRPQNHRTPRDSAPQAYQSLNSWRSKGPNGTGWSTPAPEIRAPSEDNRANAVHRPKNKAPMSDSLFAVALSAIDDEFLYSIPAPLSLEIGSATVYRASTHIDCPWGRTVQAGLVRSGSSVCALCKRIRFVSPLVALTLASTRSVAPGTVSVVTISSRAAANLIASETAAVTSAVPTRPRLQNAVSSARLVLLS